jgi:sugar/nucleoside kinase (ribokinase family)
MQGFVVRDAEHQQRATGGSITVRRVLVLAVGTIVLLTACASESGVASLSLARLASEQERFDGSIVRTQGRLRAFVDPDGTRYVVVEDARADRVLVEPAWAAQRFLRARVILVGCFTASATSDRTLRVSSIVRTDRGQPHRVRVRSRGSCQPAGRQTAA